MGDRFEVIMAGVGGQGVLTAGRLLAEVSVDEYEHITWMSSYRAARRGGACECTVILSRDEIASFILSKANVLTVMASSQLETFLDRVKPGGLLIYETSGHAKEMKRSDIRLLPVNAIEIANRIGAVQATNMIFLGVFIGMTGAVPAGRIEKKLEIQYHGKALGINKEAYQEGLKLAENRNEFTSDPLFSAGFDG